MFQKIKNWLNSKSIEFREIHHKPTRTSEESAKARGEDISIGGKALILKINDSFKIFVLSACKKLDSTSIKKHFNIKRIRFANKDEFTKLTGLKPGSFPPFGKPIIDLEIYVDNTIVNNKKIAFNAGSPTDSIIMSVKDYLELTQPKIFDFSKD
jgi:prolyl-tRNA editing enzyme YbaK/EbsC (Cys-tRNA(Pro) deacylase)